MLTWQQNSFHCNQIWCPKLGLKSRWTWQTQNFKFCFKPKSPTAIRRCLGHIKQRESGTSYIQISSWSSKQHQKAQWIQIIPIVFLPPTGSCRDFNPASLQSTASPRSLRFSWTEMPHEYCSFGQAPLGTQCHAAAGIWEQLLKSTTSSSCEWSSAPSRSAAPSPWSRKHLQCLSKVKSWNNFPQKMTLTLNWEKSSKRDKYCAYSSQYTLCKKHRNTFNHFSLLRGAHRNLLQPWRAAASMRLLGGGSRREDRRRNPLRRGGSNASTLWMKNPRDTLCQWVLATYHLWDCLCQLWCNDCPKKPPQLWAPDNSMWLIRKGQHRKSVKNFLRATPSQLHCRAYESFDLRAATKEDRRMEPSSSPMVQKIPIDSKKPIGLFWDFVCYIFRNVFFGPSDLTWFLGSRHNAAIVGWSSQLPSAASWGWFFSTQKKQPHEAADRDEQPSKQILRGEFLNFIVGERAGVLQREMSVRIKFIANPSGSFPWTCTNHTNHHKSV